MAATRRVRPRRCGRSRTCFSAFPTSRPTTSFIPTSSFAWAERYGTATAKSWRSSAAEGEATRSRLPMIPRSLPKQWQRRFLGDLNQATFESLFGIDHERLSQAGEEIRTGKGTLGELLFAAGAGLAGLRRAQQTLQQGLDDLFKPRAQNPRINKALTELENSQKELKRQQLTIEEWQQRDGAYREALADAERLREQIRKDRVEHGRLNADQVSDSLDRPAPAPDAASWQKLGDSVRLRDGFGAEFRAAQDKRTLAEHAIAKARAAIEEIKASLAALNPSRSSARISRARSRLFKSDWGRSRRRAAIG